MQERILFMSVKAKDNDKSKEFKGCEPKHRDEVVHIISRYDEVFQKPSKLSLNKEIQDECYTSKIIISKVSQLSQSVASVANDIIKCQKCRTFTIMV